MKGTVHCTPLTPHRIVPRIIPVGFGLSAMFMQFRKLHSIGNTENFEWTNHQYQSATNEWFWNWCVEKCTRYCITVFISRAIFSYFCTFYALSHYTSVTFLSFPDFLYSFSSCFIFFSIYFYSTFFLFVFFSFTMRLFIFYLAFSFTSVIFFNPSLLHNVFLSLSFIKLPFSHSLTSLDISITHLFFHASCFF